MRDARPELDAELAALAAPDASVDLVGSRAPLPRRRSTLGATAEHRALVTISTEGDKAPLFIVHGAGGNVLFLWSLARAMAGDRPIYGFQAHGVDGTDMPDPTIEDMAARYVAELRAAHRGPYLLGGYSGGGIVTFEMVRQLQALGEEVRYLVLFDSVPPGKAGPVDRRDDPQRRSPTCAATGYCQAAPLSVPSCQGHDQAVRPDATWTDDLRRRTRRSSGLRRRRLGFVNLYYYFSAVAERYEIGARSTSTPPCSRRSGCGRSQPHDYHWRPAHTVGELDIVEVPGDHNTMFYPENAPRLAEAQSSSCSTDRGL